VAERNLLLRIVSAAVGLPLVGLVVFWRQPLGISLLTLLVGVGALAELGALVFPAGARGARRTLVVLGGGLLLGLVAAPHLAHAWIVGLVVASALFALATTREDLPAAARGFASLVAGSVYIAGPLSTFPLLHREQPFGSWWLATGLAVTFANDTGAYFAGRAFGRHKLAPAISPGKTVEGAVGGLLAGVGVVALGSVTVFPELGLLDALVIGVGAGILGPCGDLVESLLKRAAGAKDSGRLIPGHGGLLDRLDALLFVVAFVYFYARFLR